MVAAEEETSVYIPSTTTSSQHLLSTSNQYLVSTNSQYIISTSSEYISGHKLEAASPVTPSQWRPGLSRDTAMAQLDYKGLVSIHGLFKLTELVTSNK